MKEKKKLKKEILTETDERYNNVMEKQLNINMFAFYKYVSNE